MQSCPRNVRADRNGRKLSLHNSSEETKTKRGSGLHKGAKARRQMQIFFLSSSRVTGVLYVRSGGATLTVIEAELLALVVPI